MEELIEAQSGFTDIIDAQGQVDAELAPAEVTEEAIDNNNYPDPAEEIVLHAVARRTKARNIRTRSRVLHQSRPLSDNAADDYMVNLGEYPVLDKNVITDLFISIEEGRACEARVEEASKRPNRAERQAILAGRAAKEKIWKHNLRLVVSIAKRYTQIGKENGMEMLDLVSEGNLGLEHSIEKFDYKMGFTFATYSTFWIKQAIQRGLSDRGGTIRLPSGVTTDVNIYKRTYRFLKDEVGIEPNEATIADWLGWSIDKVKTIRAANSNQGLAISYDKPMSEEEGSSSLIDVLVDDDAQRGFEDAEKMLEVRQLLDTLGGLDSLEKGVIIMRFGLGGTPAHTQEEVGSYFGFKRDKVSRIEKRALEKLRNESV